MSWIYKQSTGQLFYNGAQVAVGYSGHGDGKNNPDKQYVRDVGPVCEGEYEIGPPHDTATHGPYVMALTPCEGTDTRGRGNFLIHGDSVAHPGEASLGCVILARATRERIWESGDHHLQVIA